MIELPRAVADHPPGSSGWIMNGGAWLTLDGLKVDVLLRDLDTVLHFIDEVMHGHYDVDAGPATSRARRAAWPRRGRWAAR